jgi:hypothetical protein
VKKEHLDTKCYTWHQFSLTLVDTVMNKAEVFWVVTPCSDVVGYRRFGGPSYLHLQDEVDGMGGNGTDIGTDWRVRQVPLVSEPRRPRLQTPPP